MLYGWMNVGQTVSNKKGACVHQNQIRLEPGDPLSDRLLTVLSKWFCIYKFQCLSDSNKAVPID